MPPEEEAVPSGRHVLPWQPLSPERLPRCWLRRGSALGWRDDSSVWVERLEEEEEDGRQGSVWWGGRALPRLRPLLRRPLLRPPPLDPHLQAGAAGGAGVQPPAPRPPRPGALPEVPLPPRPRLPGAAGAGRGPGGGGAVRPRLPARFAAVCGRPEAERTAPRVPEGLESHDRGQRHGGLADC